MNILLGDITAFRLWRLPALCAIAHTVGPAPVSLQSLGCQAEAVAWILEKCPPLAVLPTPLDLFVPSKPARRTSHLVTPHVLSSALASERAYRLEKGVYVCSPRATLLQLARTRDVVDLALAAMELCGTYGRAFASNGCFTRREPLATCGSLVRFVQRQPEGARGKGRLLQALRFAADRAASPMETIAALLLSLPGTQGGYGLGGLQLNCPLEVPVHLRTAAGRSSVRCDLYYPAGRIAVEYDSDQFHSNADQIGSDSKRRTALELMGIHTISLTRAQLMDLHACDAVATALARRLKRKLPRVQDFRDRQVRLHTRLLDFSREL